MNEGDETIHQFGHFFKVRRNVAADVNRFFAEATTELRYMGHSNMVEGPNHVFIESGMIVLQSNFGAVRQ
jgi:hypothetical protein